MEFMEEDELSDYVSQKGTLIEEDTHSKNIIHCDLKPENLSLTKK